MAVEWDSSATGTGVGELGWKLQLSQAGVWGRSQSSGLSDLKTKCRLLQPS